MRRFRISIADLMIIILFVACGFAALKKPSYPLASLLFSLAATLATLATLGAVTRRGRWRASRAGFAIFAWAYLYLAMGPWERVYPPPYLFTSYLMSELQPGIAPHLKATPTPNYRGWTQEIDYAAYRSVGHSLAAILSGLIGAFAGRLLASREGSEEGESSVR